MKSTMQQLGITERDLMSSRVVDGTSFTVDEMLSIYVGSKNTEKTLAMVYGNNISFPQMRMVISQMKPQEKALGDAIIVDYEANYPRLRKAFIEYTDGKYDLGKVRGGYSPIRRTMEGYIPTEEELAKELVERVGLRKSYVAREFTKERKKIPAEYQQPIRLGETALWSEQMEKQEHFISHSNLVKELHKMLGDKEWREAVKNKYGNAYLETIKNWVNNVSRAGIYKTYGQLEKTAVTLRQNVAIAHLGLNIITMFKQAPSLALFLNDASIPELIGGIWDLTHNYKENIKLIHDLSPQMKNRSIQRELEELKNSDPRTYRRIIKKFGEKAMIGIYGMDKLVTHAGWKAIYNRQLRLGFSQQEAADSATRAVLRTQPAARAKDLPAIFMTNEFLNWFTQYTNQLNQIYNMITYDIPTAARTGRHWDAMRGLLGVAISAYLIYSLSYRRFPATLKDVKNMIIDSTLNYIPIVGRNLASMRKGYGMGSVPALSGFSALGGVLQGIEKGNFPKMGGKLIEAGASFLGLPYAQPKRTIKMFLKKPKSKKKKSKKSYRLKF